MIRVNNKSKRYTKVRKNKMRSLYQIVVLCSLIFKILQMGPIEGSKETGEINTSHSLIHQEMVSLRPMIFICKVKINWDISLRERELTKIY